MLDGTERALDGTERTLDGSERALDGSKRTLDGIQRTLDGVQRGHFPGYQSVSSLSPGRFSRSPGNPPPVITATGTHATNVVLTSIRNGWSGVKVQGRPQGAALWEDLGQDNYSPYVDTRPLASPAIPEMREYRMCHMDGDTPLLNWSDIAVVTVVP